MAAAEDQLLTSALAAKALATAQQALAAAQAAEARQAPEPLDVAALLTGFVQALARLKLPAPAVNVAAADAPQINVAAPEVNVAAPPAAEVRVFPTFNVDVPQQTPPQITVEGPTVNVEPTPVNVEAPRVTVNVPQQPAAPRAPWRMTVTRDQRTQLILYADIVPIEAAAA